MPIAIPGTTQCMDATEVSANDYAAFLAAKGADTSGQSTVCAWNTSYVPAADWPRSGSAKTLPVTNVDWCDAAGYCAWAGKHLCGTLTGASTDLSQPTNAAVDLWYYACSHGGDANYKFPYGATYAPQACRGADAQPANGPQTTIAGGSLATCTGGYPGLFDLSGNVAEWEDACSSAGAAASQTCLLRGGGLFAPETTLFCAELVDKVARNSQYGWAGIRCCSDAR